MRIQGNTPDPIKAGEGRYPLRISFQGRESRYELILQRFHTAKHSIGKLFLPYFIPERLDRVPLRTPGRHWNQPQVGGQLQALGSVPAQSLGNLGRAQTERAPQPDRLHALNALSPPFTPVSCSSLVVFEVPLITQCSTDPVLVTYLRDVPIQVEINLQQIFR